MSYLSNYERKVRNPGLRGSDYLLNKSSNPAQAIEKRAFDQFANPNLTSSEAYVLKQVNLGYSDHLVDDINSDDHNVTKSR